MDNKEAYQIAALFTQLGRLGTRPGDPRDRFLDYQLQNAQVGIQQELMKEAQKKQEKGLKGALGGGIGKILGGAAGMAIGGPVGAGIGAGLGSAGGQLAGGGTIADPMSAVSAMGSAYNMGTKMTEMQPSTMAPQMQAPKMTEMQPSTMAPQMQAPKMTEMQPSTMAPQMQAPKMISAPTPSTQATPQPTITNPLPQVTGPIGNNTVLVPQQGAPLSPPKPIVAQQAPQPQNAMNQFMGFLGGAAQQINGPQQTSPMSFIPRYGGGYNYYPNGQPMNPYGYGGY